MAFRNILRTTKRNLLRVQAVEWPDQELLDAVEENFPDAGVADAEEARVRFPNISMSHLPGKCSLQLPLQIIKSSDTCLQMPDLLWKD